MGSGIISTENGAVKMHKAGHLDNAVAGYSFLSFPVTGMTCIVSDESGANRGMVNMN